MNDIHLFLAHAVRLEMEAARRFEELAEAMLSSGNREVAAFFQQMAGYSRQHLAEAQSRSGFRPLPALDADAYRWPDGTSPETAGWEGVDTFMDVAQALALALASERQGQSFYATIATTTENPRVKVMAAEFAAEEAGHVAQLEQWAARLDASPA